MTINSFFSIVTRHNHYCNTTDAGTSVACVAWLV